MTPRTPCRCQASPETGVKCQPKPLSRITRTHVKHQPNTHKENRSKYHAYGSLSSEPKMRVKTPGSAGRRGRRICLLPIETEGPPANRSRCAHQKRNTIRRRFAGEEGFEPSDGGSKVRCLTTWRLPSGMSILPAGSSRRRESSGRRARLRGNRHRRRPLPLQPLADHLHELRRHLEHGHVSRPRRTRGTPSPAAAMRCSEPTRPAPGGHRSPWSSKVGATTSSTHRNTFRLSASTATSERVAA